MEILVLCGAFAVMAHEELPFSTHAPEMLHNIGRIIHCQVVNRLHPPAILFTFCHLPLA